MSMSDLLIMIQEMLQQGCSYDEIAKATGAPLEWIRDVDFQMYGDQ